MSDPTQAAELVDKAEVANGHALVSYSHTEAALADLREKYKDAKYDLTTTAGDKAARGARLALVNLRGDLERKRKELKAPAIEFGKKIDSEAARITGEILALEAPIDTQIKADETRREAERRVREEAEAARKKVHTDAIAKIAGYVGLAADLSSERLAVGIATLEGMALSGFEEFTEEATATRDRTLGALRALHIKAKAREDEDARLQAERAEQARVAAEQAEMAKKLQAQQEALAAEERRLEAERARIRAEEQAKAEREARERIAAEQRQREQEEAAARAAQAPAPTPAPTAAPTPAPAPALAANVVPMPTKAPAAPAVPTLRLGQINERIAPLSIDAAGLASLGFPHAATDKAAKLFFEADFPRICAALVARIQSAQNQQAAA